MEISREEADDYFRAGQEEHPPMVEEKYFSGPDMEVEEFLAFCNPCPEIDSEPPPKIPQRQVEERNSIVQQLEIASVEDSDGTTLFHPLSVEESVSPENLPIQQQH